MPTRNIVLTESQDSFVGELVDSGRYKSASEVIRDGLRMLEDGIAGAKLNLRISGRGSWQECARLTTGISRKARLKMR